MEKLKIVIDEHRRWSELSTYISRIEGFITSDFSLALENAKAMLETIGKEICKSKNVEVRAAENIDLVLKKAFKAVGYSSDDLITQISTSLANIGKKMGELRNEIGSTSHGMPLEELKERNNKIDVLTKEFLIDSTEIVSCLLIRSFESNESLVSNAHEKIQLSEHEDFNDFWDDMHGEFSMGEYTYQASEILFSVDKKAYEEERNAYMNREEEEI